LHLALSRPPDLDLGQDRTRPRPHYRIARFSSSGTDGGVLETAMNLEFGVGYARRKVGRIDV
jgi:hypothetical protein